MSELVCHYCYQMDRDRNGDVVGFLIDMRTRWERPVCEHHRLRAVLGVSGAQGFRDLNQPPLELVGRPCGSWRICAFIEGNAADERWCERVQGPCPFPNAAHNMQQERPCQDELESLYVAQRTAERVL